MRIRSSIDSISLDSLRASHVDLSKKYIYNLDSYIMFIGSWLMIVVDIFWAVMEIAFHALGGTTLTYIGVSIGIVFPAIMLVYLKKRDEDDYSLMRGLVIFFHLTVISIAVLLDIARLINDPNSAYGISLSLVWLVLCALVPMTSKLDSIVVMAILSISTVLPAALISGGVISVIPNMVVAFGIVIAYFGFRTFAFWNSRLIKLLAETSYTDFQSKALNKRAMSEYIESLKAKQFMNVGVIDYDIDDFKSYNDRYTRSEGDKLLSRISGVVNSMLYGENAMVFRQAGGEFVAFLENISEEKLLKIALKVKDIVESMAIERHDNTLRDYVTVTVGCSHATKAEFLEKDILNEVDTQLFIGKNGTKDCVVYKGRIYIAEGEISLDQQPTLYTERVAQAVNEAMKNNEMKVYFQPLYDTTTQRMVGSEALSRWQKSDGTIILPAEYIPELEKNSSILELDWYMFKETCRVLKKLKEMDIPQQRVSVNFSRMHVLYERDIDKRLCEIADSYSIKHNLIEIEVTESAYIHFPNIMEPMIKAIRSAGFAVAVDDFGSGASSLEFIKNVDVDTLKIDKSLISSNCTDEKERVLLESVVLLAHRLQLNSVAEGVETMEQLGFLKTLGCKQIQGFIFSMPLTEDDYIELCRNEASEVIEETPATESSQFTSVNMLLDTVFKEYPVVIMSNLTRNSYYTMTYEDFTDHSYPQAGVLTALHEEIASTLIPEDQDEFRRLFSIERQMQAYKDGEAKFTFIARVHNDRNRMTIKNVNTVSYYIKEKGNKDLMVVTLCSEKPY